MEEPGAATIHARVVEVQDRLDRRDDDGAVVLARRFLAEFPEAGDDGWLVSAIAYVAVMEAIALRQLARVDEALAAFERLRSRFAESPDPFVRDHVARGMIHRALMLASVERRPEALAAYNEMIAVFDHDPDPRIGRRVAWAIWNQRALLEALGREAELPDLYEQLARRHDEGVEARLDENIAWCLHQRTRRIVDVDAHIEVFEEIVRRFGGSPATGVRRTVLDALLNKAAALTRGGESDGVLSVYDEIVDRFGEAPESELRDGVADALRRKAIVLDKAGRSGAAKEAFDAALAHLADARSPELIARRADILLNKGVRLMADDAARAEAVVLFDGAVATCREAMEAGRTSEEVTHVVRALTYKVDQLCRLGRSGEADAALAQLVTALGDVTEPGDAADLEPAPADEDALARAVAEAFVAGDCWTFLDPPHRDAPRQTMAERAIELYRLTEPWASTDDDAPPSIFMAVGMVRDIADGYALLSTSWAPDEYATLPLPTRVNPQRTELIRRFGIEDWLAEHGHGPIASARPGDSDEPQPEREELNDDELSRFWALCSSVLHVYGLRLAVCDSRAGRRVLRNDEVRHGDLTLLARARGWAGRLDHEHPLVPMAGMCVMVAQGLFVSSHAEPRGSQAVVPSREMLRALLADDDLDLRQRAEDAGVALPGWLGPGIDPGSATGP